MDERKVVMIELKIEGNYIDSFIYSGSFFLLDSEMRLTSFPWKDVINCIEEKSQEKKQLIYNYFSGEKYDVSLIKEESFNYIINKEKMDKISQKESNKHCVIDFDYWVTDIDIYKNTLFISSHEGIDNFATNRQELRKGEPKFEFFPQQKNKLTEQKVFDITVGNYSRLIATCGKDGALQINMKSKDEKGGLFELSTDIYQLSDDIWINCDWDSEIGIAVIKNKLKQEFFKFNTINKDEIISDESGRILFEKLNKENKRKVIQEKHPEKMIKKDNVINSWIVEENGNKKIVFLDIDLNFHQLNLDNFVEEQSNIQAEFEMTDFSNLHRDLILETQKTDFGIVIETLDKLFFIPNLYSGNKINKPFSLNCVTNWRTFPKSKNYRNQLHIVQNDHVSIIGFNLE